jgi:hypothetical protein
MPVFFTGAEKRRGKRFQVFEKPELARRLHKALADKAAA